MTQMSLTFAAACKKALALPGVTTKDHFGSIAFVAHGRTLATAWRSTNTVNLMFDPPLQEKYVGLDGDGFSIIDNGWGRQGATTCHLAYVDEGDFDRALADAWERSKTARPRVARNTSETKRATAAPRSRAKRPRG